jgi:hypothetical protein
VCGCGVGIWIFVYEEGGHECFTGEKWSGKCIVCAGDAVAVSAASFWGFVFICFWEVGWGVGDGEEKTAHCKSWVFEDIPVILRPWVKICEEDLDYWGWVYRATVSVSCAAGSGCDGLLANMEVIARLCRCSAGWWRG